MAMPVNERYKNCTGMVKWPVIRALVMEYGNDRAAEERIVERLCTEYPPRPEIGWINTDLMRHRIRKAQGRKAQGRPLNGRR